MGRSNSFRCPSTPDAASAARMWRLALRAVALVQFCLRRHHPDRKKSAHYRVELPSFLFHRAALGGDTERELLPSAAAGVDAAQSFSVWIESGGLARLVGAAASWCHGVRIRAGAAHPAGRKWGAGRGRDLHASSVAGGVSSLALGSERIAGGDLHLRVLFLFF